MPRTQNLFLPFLKRKQQVGWRGFAHRWLTRLGSGWRAAPIRRLVQALTLALFLYLFFYACWPYIGDGQFSQTTLSDKAFVPVEWVLLIDPLVGLSTALAGKALNWPTLLWMVGILLLCVFFTRGFCGYLCPLGTLIDVFDWLVGRHAKRLHLGPHGWWVHIKYYLLAGVLVSSLFGVLTSGFVSAIPVLTRGLLFTGGRGQLAMIKGWENVGDVGASFYVSIGLFVLVFALSLLGKRFWCRYVCPSGALLSVANLFRVGERKVESTCINCNKCVEICPFDAIKEDFTTRTPDCTFCQSCGGVCPTEAIKFVTRWNTVDLKTPEDTPVIPRPLSRRGFLAASVAGVTSAALATAGWGFAVSASPPGPLPLRPPGSVPEGAFLDLCIRCGECFKVCPGPVLHPAGLEHGFESLWTPVAVPVEAGCHQDCNFCTQVCPTGAIQPMPLEVKRQAHMGLAKINTVTCLPYRNGDAREYCDECYRECAAAGYDAIRMVALRFELDPPPPEGTFSDDEIEEMSTIQAPQIIAEACVGCGICEYRCQAKLVVQTGKLDDAAVIVYAENEHRLMRFPATLPAPNTPMDGTTITQR